MWLKWEGNTLDILSTNQGIGQEPLVHKGLTFHPPARQKGEVLYFSLERDQRPQKRKETPNPFRAARYNVLYRYYVCCCQHHS